MPPSPAVSQHTTCQNVVDIPKGLRSPSTTLPGSLLLPKMAALNRPRSKRRARAVALRIAPWAATITTFRGCLRLLAWGRRLLQKGVTWNEGGVLRGFHLLFVSSETISHRTSCPHSECNTSCVRQRCFYCRWWCVWFQTVCSASRCLMLFLLVHFVR